MRNRIWTELTQAKLNVEFTALYSERQRAILRYFNIFILVFSSGGIMGWRIWDNAPLLSCGLIAIMSLLRLIQPHLIMTDKQLSNIESIYKFYFDYYNRLERLWYDVEQGTLDNETIKSRFFEIKGLEVDINETINETIRTKPKKLIQKATNFSNEYFKLSFNTYHHDKKDNPSKNQS